MKTMTVDGKPIVNLPPCTHTRLSVEFSTAEQAFYDVLKEQSKAVVRNLQDNSGGCAAVALFCRFVLILDKRESEQGESIR
jgi:hypothetical protein